MKERLVAGGDRPCYTRAGKYLDGRQVEGPHIGRAARERRPQIGRTAHQQQLMQTNAEAEGVHQEAIANRFHCPNTDREAQNLGDGERRSGRGEPPDEALGDREQLRAHPARRESVEQPACQSPDAVGPQGHRVYGHERAAEGHRGRPHEVAKVGIVRYAPDKGRKDEDQDHSQAVEYAFDQDRREPDGDRYVIATLEQQHTHDLASAKGVDVVGRAPHRHRGEQRPEWDSPLVGE